MFFSTRLIFCRHIALPTPIHGLLMSPNVRNIFKAMADSTGIRTAIIRAPDGFQKEINALIESDLIRNQSQPKQPLYLRYNKISNSSQNRSEFERYAPDVAMMSVVLLFFSTQALTTFGRGDAKTAWELETPNIAHSYVFLYFVQFFTTALQLGGLVAKYALKSSPHPAVQLSGKESVVAPNFPLSGENMIGGYDINQTSSNRFFITPSLLSFANHGVLSVRPLQLDQGAMTALTDLISNAPHVLDLGGNISHQIPLEMIIKFDQSNRKPIDDTTLLNQSGRIQRIITINTIHQFNLDVAMHLLKEEHAAISEQYRIPFTELKYQHLANCLKLSRWRMIKTNEIDSSEYMIWTPEIRNIIRQVFEFVVLSGEKTDRPPISLRDTFYGFLTPLVLQEVRAEIRAAFPDIDTQFAPLDIKPTESLREFKAVRSAFLRLNNSTWETAVSDRKNLLGTNFTLFDATPLKSDPAVIELESKNPFIFIAGHDALIGTLLLAADLRCKRAGYGSFDAPEKSLVVVLTDGDEAHAKRQYSGGKSTIFAALMKYVDRKYAELKIQTPVQLMVPDNGDAKYTVCTKSESKRYTQQTIIDHWPLFLTMAAQNLLFLSVHIAITDTIFETVSSFEDRFSMSVFPWILLAVTMGLSGAIVGGSSMIDKRLSDPDAVLLNSEDHGVINLPVDITKTTLLGKSQFTPTAPQTQLRNNRRIWVTDMNYKSAFIENAQDMDPLILETIFRITDDRYALLGEQLPIPFSLRVLGVAGNDPSGEIQAKAANYADVRAEISVLLDYPNDTSEKSQKTRKILEQLFVFHCRQTMKTRWDNESMNWLLDKCILNDRNKIFFGIRYIKNLIADIDDLKGGASSPPQQVSLALLEATWQQFLKKDAYIASYFKA